MVGLVRTVVPLIGEQEFGLASKTAIVSFIISFGIVKAICNFFAARISESWGRKRVLVLGWMRGLPGPFIIIYANRWIWFDVANILLGINQALTWSMTVIMKVDLVGPTRRGLALGLNEFAGYLAVGGGALGGAEIAEPGSSRTGPRDGRARRCAPRRVRVPLRARHRCPREAGGSRPRRPHTIPVVPARVRDRDLA